MIANGENGAHGVAVKRGRVTLADMSGAPTEPGLTRADVVMNDLDGVERALERLDRATYGVCVRCGNVLAEEALATDPLALRCTPSCPEVVRGAPAAGDPEDVP